MVYDVYLVWEQDYDECNLLGIYATKKLAEKVIREYNEGELTRSRPPFAYLQTRGVIISEE